MFNPIFIYLLLLEQNAGKDDISTNGDWYGLVQYRLRGRLFCIVTFHSNIIMLWSRHVANITVINCRAMLGVIDDGFRAYQYAIIMM